MIPEVGVEAPGGSVENLAEELGVPTECHTGTDAFGMSVMNCATSVLFFSARPLGPDGRDRTFPRRVFMPTRRRSHPEACDQGKADGHAGGDCRLVPADELV